MRFLSAIFKIEKNIKFYDKAEGLKVQRKIKAAFTIAKNNTTSFM